MHHSKLTNWATMGLLIVANSLTGCRNDVGYLLDSDTAATASATSGSPASSTSVEPTTLEPESLTGSTTEEPDTTESAVTTDMSTSEASSGSETDVDSDTDSDTDTGQETTGAMCDCPCSDSTCISNCGFSSCRDIATSLGCLPSGYGYSIKRANDTVDVYCDNGWTYRPIVRKQNERVTTLEANEVCDTFGMNLFYPSSQEHLQSAMELAISIDYMNLDHDDTYLNLMGILPDYETAVNWDETQACTGVAFSSINCPTWTSFDGGPWWVGSIPIQGQPNPAWDSTEHSMKYRFSEDQSRMLYRTSLSARETTKFFCTVYPGDDV